MESEIENAVFKAKALLVDLENVASSAGHKVSGDFNTAKQYLEKMIAGLESHLSLIKSL